MQRRLIKCGRWITGTHGWWCWTEFTVSQTLCECRWPCCIQHPRAVILRYWQGDRSDQWKISCTELDVPEGRPTTEQSAPCSPRRIRLLLHLLENAAVNTLLHLSPTPFSRCPWNNQWDPCWMGNSPLALQRKATKPSMVYVSPPIMPNQSTLAVGLRWSSTSPTEFVQSKVRQEGEP